MGEASAYLWQRVRWHRYRREFAPKSSGSVNLMTGGIYAKPEILGVALLLGVRRCRREWL